MNRFDITLFGFRLVARGNAGIVGALTAIGMIVGLAVLTALLANAAP